MGLLSFPPTAALLFLEAPQTVLLHVLLGSCKVATPFTHPLMKSGSRLSLPGEDRRHRGPQGRAAQPLGLW